jgi:four helix bundle protein
MAHKYRELNVWKRSMGLVTDVYVLTRSFPREELFGLTSQLRRATISVPLNIAEGAGSDSPKEFRRFLVIALRSLYETMTALEIAERLKLASKSEVQRLLDEADQIAGMLVGLGKSLEARSDYNKVKEAQEWYDVDEINDVDRDTDY